MRTFNKTPNLAMEAKYLDKTLVNAIVDGIIKCHDEECIYKHVLSHSQCRECLRLKYATMLEAWGYFAYSRDDVGFKRLCHSLYEMCGISIDGNDSYGRRREMFFEMVGFRLRVIRCCAYDDMSVGAMRYLGHWANDDEEQVLEEAVDCFMKEYKELINVLAEQDLSGEGIRNFVGKVFKH